MILIALGSNLPFLNLFSAEILCNAMSAVARLGQVVTVSSLYESEAWPDPTVPRYTNAAMCLKESPLSPEQLLNGLHVIETAYGRLRTDAEKGVKRYASRTLDLDLLSYHDLTICHNGSAGLRLPHPAIEDRDFVLLPLLEIVPHWRHSGTKKTPAEMLASLQGKGAKLTAQRRRSLEIK